ncbi:MAG TPA: C25 family cysteine peptidase [Candidatus Eisenbacteria bacterium]|nr:C25 family cysteine peptidase [Candidatus Eisenbacteria bacterium]
MRSPLRPVALVACLLIPVSTAFAAPTVIEKEIRYDAGRFSLSEKDGQVLVGMKGSSSREDVAGRPDLPQISEMIDLPPDARIARVEVLSLGTELLSAAARVPTAAKARPGLGPIDRTDPDPAFYRRAGFAPWSEQVTVGYQGWMRGRHIASLKVSPVRWDATSGRLERISSMRLRLTLEPFQDPDMVPRERIVPEWESDRPFPEASASTGVGPRGPAQPFMPTQIPSVLGSPVAYVILTNDALAPEFQRLADWKTQSGVPAVVRTLSFVRQQYPFGTDDADRVRQFIRDAYARWGTKWVLLGGDTDVIPHRTIYTTFFSGENIPCDMYFSCLDGNWNADGDSTYGEGYFSPQKTGDNADLFPEVYVGRAPVSTVADVQLFVNKNFQYTRTPVGDYEHTVLFFAEVLFPQDWVFPQVTSLDGAELVEEVLPSLLTNPGIHYGRLYQNYTDARWSPGSIEETKARVLDSLTVGYNMTIHVGHGYRNVMSVGDDNIDNSHAMALTNGNRLSNLYAIDCNSNSIDFPCLGEAFLKAPNGGAVSNIGSTRFDFPHAGRAFQKEYFRLMFEDSVTAVGETQALQKMPFAASSFGDNINRWTCTTLLMLGDPEQHQWTGKPRTLTVTHPPTFALGESTMTVNVKIAGVNLYGARVTLYKPGDDYRFATTNGAGNAVVEFRPGSTGTFYVTVTAFDCRPKQDTLTVGAATTEVLADLTPTVDDDNVSGTSGNGNALFDAGEVIDLHVPVINRGNITANTVNGVLSTTDGLVSITDVDVAYGNITAGATSNPAGAYRLTIPYTAADQREIPFKLDLVDANGRHFIQRFTLTVFAPDPRHYAHTLTDSPGNGNGIPEAGETINYLVKLRNLGTGPGATVTAKLRNYDGLATVSDSTTSFGTIAPGAEVQGDALVFVPSNAAAKLELRISTPLGLMSTQMIDLVRPTTPIGLLAMGSQSSIALSWARNPAADLAGYNVYRSASQGGPFVKVNAVPTDPTSYYRDEGLAPLTRYYYKVTAVDSSGNESPQSVIIDTSTNPPNHGLFPQEMRRATPAPVAIDYMHQDSQADIVAGADVLWMWRADGTAPVDADGTEASHGDFTGYGTYYAGGASLSPLTGSTWSVIGASWRTTAPESTLVYVFDLQGNLRPGWPFGSTDGSFSGIAVGDLNNDGSRELVMASNGSKFYVLRANGTEWMDGDANPSTQGVFKQLGSCCHYGTPALADLDGNGELDIIFASFDGKVYAWRPNGNNLPGFPVTLGGTITSSVAIGYLDGVSDTQLDIAITDSNDSLYVLKADGGRKAGFPKGIRLGGTTKQPSPALADMNLDGFVDIVVAGTDGRIYVYDNTGALSPLFLNSRYSTLSDFASESSPVVADINGDGLPDVVMGDENGQLNGISGTGTLMAGFPIQLGGEVRGTPALCDCDLDGKTEIVVSSWDLKTYMWDYDFPFSPGVTPPWPQFHHDARRTGFLGATVFLDAPGPGTLAAPVMVEFGLPEPNPTRTGARVTWAVPADRAGAELDLSVYDLAGRRLASLASGTAQAGRFTAEWDLRNGSATRVGAGIYFMRLRVGPTIVSRKLVVMP